VNKSLFFYRAPDHHDFLGGRGSARQPSLLLGASRRAQPFAWWVPKGSTFVWRQKEPTTVALFETHHATVTPRPASFNELDARNGRASQPAAPKQGSPDHLDRPPRGPGGRRRTLGNKQFRNPDERARNHIFRMIH